MTYVTEPKVVFGIDIGKREVVVNCFGEPSLQRLANQIRPLRAWLATLPAGALLVMEATNTYHELLATLACALGLQVVVLNPYRSWHYARAIGKRGKTDPVDAAMLAQFGAHEWRTLRPWQPASRGNERVARLLRRRTKLMSAKVALTQSLGTMKELNRIRREAKRALDGLIKRVDALILQVVAADPQLAQLHRLLQSIVGVGPIGAAQLAQALTRFPWAKDEAFVAYTGLDPRPDDSSTHRGRRKLTKHGPPMLRHLLHLAAMSASKTRLWKPAYQALRARGLHTTEAFVVIARRIARIAFAMFRSGQPFDPARLVKTPAAALTKP
jgi:transposase